MEPTLIKIINNMAIYRYKNSILSVALSEAAANVLAYYYGIPANN